MDENKKAFKWSLAAFLVSFASLLFSGLQWYEAHASRVSQAASTKKAEDEQKLSRQLTEMQVMAAERANILAQRQQNPRLAKDESDMPALICYSSETELLRLQTLPLLNAPHQRTAGQRDDPVQEFLSSKERSITLLNKGASTAYSVVATNRGVYGEPDDAIFAREVPSGLDPITLAPGSSFGVPVKDDEPPPANALELFRKGDASYYMIGKVEYRDAFQRLKNNSWCYEFRVKRKVGDSEIEKRRCQADDLKHLLPSLNRIEQEREKDK